MGIYKGTIGNDSITPDGLSAGVTAKPVGTTPTVGADTIYGEAGNDTLNGGSGADTIYGGDGNDTLGVWVYDTVGDETFTGTANFYGGNGDDIIKSFFNGYSTVDLTHATLNQFGGAGNDELNATYYYAGSEGRNGAATDVLYGGTGDDIYRIQESSDRVIEKPGEGYDTVYAYNTDYTLAPNAEKLVLGNIDTANGFSGTGNGLDNVIVGTEWNDRLNGGAGNDTIYAVDKPETASSYGGDTIHGGGGNDTIYGQGLYNFEDTINDTLYGDDGNDELFGLYGNDRMGGGSGEDRIYGEAGNDVISGTGGRDWLSGGQGDDRFDYDNVSESAPGAANGDVIADFGGAGKTGGDVIDLSSVDANSGVGGNQAFIFGGTGAGHVWAVASGADSLIRADTGGATGPDLEILVKDVAAASWTAGDFIL